VDLPLEFVVVLYKPRHVLLVAGGRVGTWDRKQGHLPAGEHVARRNRLGAAVSSHGHERRIGKLVADLDRHRGDPFSRWRRERAGNSAAELRRLWGSSQVKFQPPNWPTRTGSNWPTSNRARRTGHVEPTSFIIPTKPHLPEHS